jgi:DNA-binding response OmpR family regulator
LPRDFRARLAILVLGDFTHMREILVVGDTPEVSEAARNLAGCDPASRVRTAPSGALESSDHGREPDILVLVLDGLFPEGLAKIARLRESGWDAPILILAEQATSRERALALALGADDCLSAPIDAVELVARVDALTRRASARAPTAPSRFHFGSVAVDLSTGTVRRDKSHMSLTGKEAQLLRYFLTHPNRVVSRTELLANVWGSSSNETRTVDVHVAGLRAKLEQDSARPQLFVTVHGKGYLFRAQSQG